MEQQKVSTIRVSEPRLLEREGQPAVSASIEVGEKSYEVWAKMSQGPLSTNGDAFLVASLMPSMKLGADLQCSGSISPRLLENIPRIQEYLHSVNPEFKLNSIDAKAGLEEVANPKRGVGCFFSGGIDAFYTLLKHQEEITHLIFVHGFDIRLNNLELHEKALGAVRAISGEFGKPLIEVATNIREFSDRCILWDPYHAVPIAFLAHLLSPLLRKAYLAGGMTYDDLKPFGTNPFLFSLWSSDSMNLVGDGYEASRIDKAARVAQSSIAMKTLRVCWKNVQGVYNCCHCEKCLRTMVALRIAGVLERCSTFDRPLDLSLVSRVQFESPSHRRFWVEHLSALERTNTDPQLTRAVRDMLNQRFERGIWGLARKAVSGHPRIQRLGWRALAKLGIVQN
jgi:hypothetical protein